MAEHKAATKQADSNRDEKGQFIEGNKPVVGFHTNPENRHNGAWKKEDTPRYKLEQMMKLSVQELTEIIDDPTRPLFEHKLAQAIIDGKWTVIKEMVQEVYGKPKETVDVSNPDGSLNPYNALTAEELRKLAGK